MRQVRRRKSSKFWEMHIQKWREQGDEPLTEYCARNGLLEIQLAHWVEKLDKGPVSNPETTPVDEDKWIRIIPETPKITTEEPNETTHCEFEFANGTRLSLKSQHALSMLDVIVPLVRC